MKVTSDFCPADRYLYDFKYCTSSKGWAQFDTRQDAPYYGNWVNPSKLETLEYAEGDITHVQCESPEEFVKHLKHKIDRHKSDFVGIDAFMNEDIIKKFTDMGLQEHLH